MKNQILALIIYLFGTSAFAEVYDCLNATDQASFAKIYRDKNAPSLLGFAILARTGMDPEIVHEATEFKEIINWAGVVRVQMTTLSRVHHPYEYGYELKLTHGHGDHFEDKSLYQGIYKRNDSLSKPIQLTCRRQAESGE